MSAVADLRLDPSFESVRQIGPWLDELLALAGAEAHRPKRGEIELAVHELAVNVVEHAFGDHVGDRSLVIGGAVKPSQLVITLTDNGDEYDPANYEAPKPDMPQVGGYGLMLIRQLASSAEYARDGGHNCWTLCFGEQQVD